MAAALSTGWPWFLSVFRPAAAELAESLRQTKIVSRPAVSYPYLSSIFECIAPSFALAIFSSRQVNTFVEMNVRSCPKSGSNRLGRAALAWQFVPCGISPICFSNSGRRLPAKTSRQDADNQLEPHDGTQDTLDTSTREEAAVHHGVHKKNTATMSKKSKRRPLTGCIRRGPKRDHSSYRRAMHLSNADVGYPTYYYYSAAWLGVASLRAQPCSRSLLSSFYHSSPPIDTQSTQPFRISLLLSIASFTSNTSNTPSTTPCLRGGSA